MSYEEDLKRLEEYREEGRKAYEEDARLSVAEADGSCEVYFIQEKGMGAIKIGITSKLERWACQMQVNTPHEIKVLGSVHADARLETYLKWKFAHARIRSEWFRPVDDLIEYIEKTTHFKIAEPRLVIATACSDLINRALERRKLFENNPTKGLARKP